MPIREFECEQCHHRFEEILGIKEPNPEKCPKCGGSPLKSILGTFRVAGLGKKSATEGDADLPAGDDLGDAGGGEFGGDAGGGFGDDGGLGDGGDLGGDGGDLGADDGGDL